VFIRKYSRKFVKNDVSDKFQFCRSKDTNFWIPSCGPYELILVVLIMLIIFPILRLVDAVSGKRIGDDIWDFSFRSSPVNFHGSVLFNW
jgi:hypothetical protein